MAANVLKIGIPKGSLQDSTVDLFAKAGWNLKVSSRSYRPGMDDPELEGRILRAQEMGRYVGEGFLDCGITGRDWIVENGADVEVICDLAYSRATSQPTRWVLIVPEDSPYKTVQDLEGKRIATESPGLTKHFFKEQGVNAEIEFSWGATEVKVPELVDAIVDITETGSSIRANNLKIIAEIMESYPQFVMNKAAFADPWKRAKAERIAMLLTGALAARDTVGLKMNVEEKNLQAVLDTLPSLRLPTINQLVQDGWIAIDIVADNHLLRDLIPKLKSLGAEGIVEYPLNKVVR